jgi:hypothetical protein
LMVHSYNPSYSGSRTWEDQGLGQPVQKVSKTLFQKIGTFL